MDEFCAPARGARTAIEAATMSVLMRSRVKKSSQPVTEDCRWEARWSASILPPGCVRRRAQSALEHFPRRTDDTDWKTDSRRRRIRDACRLYAPWRRERVGGRRGDRLAERHADRDPARRQ